MKKIVIVVLVLITTFFLYSLLFQKDNSPKALVYRFDFDELDREFWLVSPWESYKRDYSLVSMNRGVLKLSSDVKGIMPYMLSQPLKIESGDVLTFERKVRLTHGEGTFAGGLAMYQTDQSDLIPEFEKGSWFSAFGEGVFLVEYSFDLRNVQDRPGRDVFRFLAADWSYNDNYQLITPIYNEWVIEKFVYDTRSHQMTYYLNDKPYKLNSLPLDRDYVRFLMHPFGSGLGNSIEMEYIEITVENKRIR